MKTKKAQPGTKVLQYKYFSPHIPLRAIRQFAQRIAAQFDPEKIILFGSYAAGNPRPESDVDLMVVMPAADEINQAVRISLAFEPVFPLDLIVRTPERLEKLRAEGDWLSCEVLDKGKVLYEKSNQEVGAKNGRGLQSRQRRSQGR